MSTANQRPAATPGAKMLYLIRRRATTSREELIAHWFANHMPDVIDSQRRQAESGRPHATRYFATLYEADRHGAHPWDGMAQLWWPEVPPAPEVPHGTEPRDTFQQKAKPYTPWATTEYVVLDPEERLVIEPLTLNPPFPCTRSGLFKVSFLVETPPTTDYDALFAHWLDVHVPNVTSVMKQVGGFGYKVSLSLQPSEVPYAGLAELYFPDEAGWAEYKTTIEADGMERWVDARQTMALRARTEMIGIA